MKSAKVSREYVKKRTGLMRSKCKLFRSICDRAIWLFKANAVQNISIVKEVLKDFYVHLDSDCYCAADSATSLAIANTYLELFYILSKSSIYVLDDVQSKLDKQRDASENRVYLSDCNIRKESRFNSDYTEYVNIANYNHLLSPLFKSLKMFEKALECDLYETYLTETTISRLYTLEQLNALFQIFYFYDLNSYALQAVNLSLRFIKNYYQNSKFSPDSEDVIIANCNLITLYLKFGCLDNAKSHHKRFFSGYDFEDINQIDSYGLCLAFLLHCELTLRSRNGKQVADKLKEFIECKYLSTNTIKRFSIKARAYLLASRFPSAIYKFKSSLCEFIQPFQMALSICRRWNMFKTYDGDSVASNGAQDPLWYRFSVYNLLSESIEVITSLYSSFGVLTDASFYYKLSCNFFIFTLNLTGLARMQLLGADFDVFNDTLKDCKNKLSLFKKLLTNCSEINYELFAAVLSSIDENDDNAKNIKQSLDDVEFIPENSILYKEIDEYAEDKQKPLDAYQVYQSLLDQRRVDDSFENNCDDFLNLKSSKENLLQNYVKEFAQLSNNLPTDKISSLFFMYIKMLVINNYLELNDDANSTAIDHNKRFMFLLKLIENYTLKIYVPQVELLIKQKTVKNSFEEQLYNGLISNIFWSLSLNYVDLFVTKKFYREALCYLDKLVEISAYSFQARVSRCRMFFYRASIIYKLIKSQYQDKSWSMFKVNTVDLSNINVKCEQVKTPTQNKKMTKASKLKAPVKGQYISTAVKDYAQSVLEITSRDGLVEGTRRNVLDFDDDLIMNGDKIAKSSKSTLKTKKCTKSSSKIAKSQSTLEEIVSNFNTAMTLDDTDERDNDETYFGKLFNLNKFLKEFNLSAYTFEDIKQLLRKINCYIGLHPTLNLYIDCQNLYFKLAKLFSKGSPTIMYHLSETMPDISFRYRSILISNRKESLSKCLKHDKELFTFKHEDFNYIPYMNDLPKDWRFLQIKVVENGTPFPDLILCRYRTGSRAAFMKIKFNQEKTLKYFLDEFNEIMEMNNSSIIETDKETFWKIRFEYDQRLKVLLQTVENNVIGAFKGFFIGKIENHMYFTACSWFKKKLLEASEQLKLKCEHISTLDVVIDSVAFLQDEECEVAMKLLFNTENADFLSKVLSFKKKYFNSWSTFEQVKELYQNVEPVGLILDTPLALFPFESMPTFRKLNQPFFRVPSLRVASIMYKTYESNLLVDGVDDERTFYILNPSNNLTNTEKFFKDPLKSIKEWNGVIGKEPNGKHLLNYFEEKDIYLFFGHGSGSPYYRSITGGFEAATFKPVALVFGCSSARICREMKNSETYGSAYRFLMNGSPCFVGNLWDVTDKDIDIFSDRFMSFWLKRWKPDTVKQPSICKSISMSRDFCKLKYLIGCAPVVYGLPLNNKLSKTIHSNL